MARPRKQVVDYFPHYCDHGKTIFILEERYGNNGYAFWFKLLETLGNTEGHFIDLNNEATMQYLRSKTRCEEGLVTEILDLLAKLNAIDPELWDSKVVWCDNFVNGISDVYTRFRHTKPPERPNNYAVKPRAEGQPTQVNPQSKVKESKVKKVYCASFQSFYDSYPKKKAPDKAWAAWQKRKDDLPSLDFLLRAIENQKESDDWKKSGGEFIPYPATWLSQGRWADEIETQESSIDAWARKKQAEMEAAKNGAI